MLFTKKLFQTLSFAVALLIGFAACGQDQKKDKSEAFTQPKESIMIFAAASLTDVFKEIIDSFQVIHPIQVKINLGSSGTLARQIEQGEIPDVFISASERWADYIDSLGLLISNTKAPITKNELVLIAPLSSSKVLQQIDSTLDFKAMLGSNRLSMGDPLHVPAGKYAKQSLEFYDWYKKIEDKILPAKDVRSALMVVELEEAPLGIVYRTDIINSKKVKILAPFPESSHKPIIYSGGLCKDSQNARLFLEFLKSPQAQNIWRKYGFTI